MTTDFGSRLESALRGTYKVEREIAGGMSRVYVAEDTTLRRRVVVKVLPPEVAADVSLARFQREIALAASLQHPHIVPLLSSGDVDGIPYYTMPFVEGETLRHRLAEGALTVAESVRLLREIATALAYAHEKGVVHRDIKPENVLLSGGVALVTDFGVAKAVVVSASGVDQHLTTAGVAVGTPAYMSPEQVSADPAIDHRADLYSFGMIAYEMLAGRSPYAGRPAAALLSAHILETPAPLEEVRADVPVALASLVARCLAKAAADRPASANEIVRALDVLGAPDHALPSIRLPRWAPRAAAAAAGLVLVAAGAWFAVGRSGGLAPQGSKVLIAPFENLTGDPAFDHIGRLAADALSAIVESDGSVDVVPSNIVLGAFRDTAGGTAKALERLTDVTHPALLVTGSIARRGDSLALQAQVTDVRAKRVVATIDPSMGSAADPITALNALGERLVGAFGMRAISVLPQRGYRAPTAAALQEFARGFELFAFRGNQRDAMPHFERAIALDSTFIRAHLMLVLMHVNLGNWAAADTIISRLERLPQRLTAAEKANLALRRSQLDGDLAGSLRGLQKAVERDSSAVMLHLIGLVGVQLLRPDLAIPALEAAAPAYALLGGVAEAGNTNALLEAYHQAGYHDRELRRILELPAVSGGGARLTAQLRAYAGKGNRREALALADSLIRVEQDSLGSTIRALASAAMEFRVHGDSVTASRLYQMAREWIASHPVGRNSGLRRIREATVFLATGLPDSAHVRLAPIDSVRPDLFVVATALRGDSDVARALADSLAGVTAPWRFGRDSYVRAAIAGALGDRGRAVELLRQANREGHPMTTWRYDVALLPLHGYQPFEELVRPRR